MSGAKRSRLSPINARRWANFKANKRGYWSLWIFLVLFALSLFAEFLANDRPILVWFKGGIYSPVMTDYPEEHWLGEDGFLAQTDYKIIEIEEAIAENGWAIWPPVRYSYRTVHNQVPEPAPSAPSWLYDKETRCQAYPLGAEDPACHLGNWNWLGTDDQARDVLARVIYGFRLSIVFTLIVTVFSSLIGIVAGAIQGFFGGMTDLVFQRVIEIWGATPQLYIIIIMFAVLGRSVWLLIVLMILFGWTSLVGVVRAEFLRARNLEYVRAARALGVSNWKIMFRHMLPNAMVATLTMLPFIVTGVIGTLATLDYLGFGLPSSAPSLGEMTLQAKQNLQAPWLGFTAFFVFAIMLSLLVFIFEGVRDAFDPRKTFS